MGKPCNYQGGHWPKNQKHPQAMNEQVNFISENGLVEIATTLGRKFPQHDYQIVALRFRPQPGTRVLPLDDGSGGIEVVLRHSEVAQTLLALNHADGKAQYRWRPVPEKPKARREFWQRINAERHSRNDGRH